ncbi:MAG TPA: Ku protein [Candidatus Acidoferrales bacterium]|nr:Ku protein [Candidatus Acidoferrales bacterium]
MATAAWKGSLTFGLLSIPIRLYSAARHERTALHLLHAKCHTRLRQPLFCPTCHRIVDRREVIKGFEYEKGRYAVVGEEDLKKITPEPAGTMEILAFVKRDQVDPIYMDTSYFALPDRDGEKAYEVLRRALEETNEMGIAHFTMHQRDYTVFVRARDHGLTMHTMYFANEIRQLPGYGETPGNLQVKPQEVRLAHQLIESLSEAFRPEKYHDTFQQRLRTLVEAKEKGRIVTEKSAPEKAKVIDMMDALRQSLHRKQERAPGPKRRRVASREGRRAAG